MIIPSRDLDSFNTWYYFHMVFILNAGVGVKLVIGSSFKGCYYSALEVILHVKCKVDIGYR